MYQRNKEIPWEWTCIPRREDLGIEKEVINYIFSGLSVLGAPPSRLTSHTLEYSGFKYLYA